MIKQALFLILLILTFFSELHAYTEIPFKKACKQGDRNACQNLAFSYKMGQGVVKNTTLAREYYKKACDLQSDVGCYQLAEFYDQGINVTQNFDTSMKYYGQSCDLGLEMGCGYFMIYYNNINYQKAKPLIEQYCRKPKAKTCTVLQEHFKKKITKEKEIFLCKTGKLKACRKVADGYFNRLDNNISTYNEAIHFYEKACKLNDGYSCHRLALIYEKSGIQFNKDYQKEIDKYATKSCMNNYIESCLYLSDLYVNGKVIKKDYKKAFRLLRHACNQNESNSCNYLAMMYYKGQGVNKDLSIAVSILETYTKQNNALSYYYLGSIYNDENNIKKDKNKALKFYQKSCELGQRIACEKVETIEEDDGFPWFKTIIIIISVLFILKQFSDYPIEEEEEPVEKEEKRTFSPKTFRMLPKKKKAFKCQSCGSRQLDKDEEHYFCKYCKTAVEWTN